MQNKYTALWTVNYVTGKNTSERPRGWYLQLPWGLSKAFYLERPPPPQGFPRGVLLQGFRSFDAPAFWKCEPWCQNFDPWPSHLISDAPIFDSSWTLTMTFSYPSGLCPNISTPPIPALGCRQCLSLSVIQLKGKHCWKPHCRKWGCRYVRAMRFWLV